MTCPVCLDRPTDVAFSECCGRNCEEAAHLVAVAICVVVANEIRREVRALIAL